MWGLAHRSMTYESKREDSFHRICGECRGTGMSVLLKVVGGIWAILGSAYIVMMFRNDVSSSIGVFGLLWNFVLFIFPGLVVYGIGAATAASHGPLRRATVDRG